MDTEISLIWLYSLLKQKTKTLELHKDYIHDPPTNTYIRLYNSADGDTIPKFLVNNEIVTINNFNIENFDNIRTDEFLFPETEK